MKQLYIIRGLPGSGKTTFAKRLASLFGAWHYEADTWHMKDGVYAWKPEKVRHAHSMCQASVEDVMKYGLDVVVSNTSTTEKELKPYLDLAEKYGYNVTSLITENRHGNQSIHGVPEETMVQMRNRFSVKL